MPVERTRVASRRDHLRSAAFVAGLVVLMIALLVGGTLLLERYLSADPTPVAAPQVSDVSAPLSRAQLNGRLRYVALGDSYSAGPGLPQQVDATCARSSSNYPSLLAKRLSTASFVDVTCSGARTVDITGDQTRSTGTVAPQADALDDDTDLVTVSVGGNDDNVFNALVTTCPEVADTDPRGHPCQTQLAGAGGAALVQQTDRLVTRVSAVIRAIRERSPRAQVVVVGYPAIFPTHGTCAALPFARGDVTWAAQVVDAVDDGLAGAARNEGVRFVDLRPASAGHDICSRKPWMSGVEAGADGSAPWHPVPRGMQGAATAIYDQLTGAAEGGSE
ncbi:SGNH/GDSL hydrolase family protein [Nocardioides acrostichi]|uniref:SGNH/GDSL hydrolase family protein n=1 Tax=Nocardioides acrostichi TaxID=2784339 RepID=A0A930V3H1_9ACTN|nr:SGNH/GDSL hydrolase family protein [Nocardioides acrostichi]MBF4162529.1 SGNH/GDSL hydrolase family protein [Nocardioides acrostichi]